MMYTYNKYCFFLLAIGMMISCKKPGLTRENLQTTTVFLFNAYAVNTTPATTSDVYFNNTKITTSAIGYATLLPNLVLRSGVTDVSFKKSSDSSLLAGKTIALDPGLIQTIYLTGVSGTTDIITTTDDFTPAPAGKARIRTIHLSPNLPAADFYIQGGPVLSQNQAFKTATEFAVVDTGSFVFQVRDAANKAVRGSSGKISLASTKCYTFIARGLVGGTPALTMHLLNNIDPY